jgi:hypothetical protein
VFVFGLVFVACGVVLTLALGKIKLSDQHRKAKARA